MIFHFFNNIAGKNIVFDEIVAFLAIYAPLIISLLMVYLFWFGKTCHSKWNIVKSLVIPCAIAGSIYFIELYLVTHVFHHDLRTRPFSHYWVNLLISQAGIPTFPAWPVVFSAIFLPVIFQYNKRIGYIASVMVFLGGLSLVIAGVHYLSDILVGWVTGLLAGILGIGLILKIPVKKYLQCIVVITLLSSLVLCSELSEMKLEKTVATHEKLITDEVNIDKSELIKLSESIGVKEIDGEYATNGRMVAVDIRIHDNLWTVNKIKQSAKSMIDQLFATHKEFSVITVEVYQGSGKKAVWLYTATVYRFDWIKGGNIPGLKGYGNKYYKLPVD
jgi:membrane-associated phospholipid phosphatase